MSGENVPSGAWFATPAPNVLRCPNISQAKHFERGNMPRQALVIKQSTA